MDITSESVLEMWEMFSEHLPPAKRDQIATRFIKILLDQEISIADFENIRGEDEHLDSAFEHFDEDVDESYGDDEEYEN